MHVAATLYLHLSHNIITNVNNNNYILVGDQAFKHISSCQKLPPAQYTFFQTCEMIQSY